MDGCFSPLLAQLLLEGLTRRALLSVGARSDPACGDGQAATRPPDNRDAVIARLVSRATSGTGSAPRLRLRVEAG